MDPTLKARLRSELDRMVPRPVAPRYATSRAPAAAWRLAPVVLAIAFTGILALTAFAATGSPNPVVWTQRVQTVINPPAPTPADESTPPQQPEHHATAAPAAPAPPKQQESPEPSERPEPVQSPEPRESPEPGDHQTSTSDSGGGERS